MVLISFDIDGTLEIGDPPGVLTMDMVRLVREKGFLIGSCSDRTLSGQRAIWKQHEISVDFVVENSRRCPRTSTQRREFSRCHLVASADGILRHQDGPREVQLRSTSQPRSGGA